MKTNIRNYLILTGLAALTLSACGLRSDGDLMTETRDVADFHALDISVSGRVDVYADSVFHLEVTAEEGALPYLETRVDHDGTLKIYFSRDLWDVDGLRVRVYAPNWNGFDISGSADVNVHDAILGNTLDARVSGSGNLRVFDLDFHRIEARVSGSGNVALNGVADDMECSVSGSGDIDALDCPVETAEATVSGSGDIRLHVTQLLDATISGSGNIEYEGNPRVTKHISGSGNVRKI